MPRRFSRMCGSWGRKGWMCRGGVFLSQGLMYVLGIELLTWCLAGNKGIQSLNNPYRK